MDNVDISVLRTAIEWHDSGHRVTLGTIVRTWGSAPRPIGAMVVIRDDGQIVGSVSGGCVEDDLVEKVAAGKLASTRPELATYGVKTEDAQRWGLPCGGTLQLVFEPISERSKLRELHDRQVEAVRYVDGVLARLFDLLPDDSWVVVTSDHGELFGEDRFFGHGPIMHEKVLEVPFVEGPVP